MGVKRCAIMQRTHVRTFSGCLWLGNVETERPRGKEIKAPAVTCRPPATGYMIHS